MFGNFEYGGGIAARQPPLGDYLEGTKENIWRVLMRNIWRELRGNIWKVLKRI